MTADQSHSTDSVASVDSDAPAGPAPSEIASASSERVRKAPLLIVALLEIVAFISLPLLYPGTFAQFMGMFWIPILATALVAFCWMFFSRVSWTERFVGVLLVGVIAIGSGALVDRSMLPLGFIVYALPTGTVLAAAVLLASDRVAWSRRRWGLTAAFAAGLGLWGFVRIDGLTGALAPTFAWRWAPTPEERVAELTPRTASVATSAETSLQPRPNDWTGFRGPDCRGQATGVTLPSDFGPSTISELWRREVGPGWSSFCVVDGRCFTQEQRGDEEAVICYDLEDGEPIWVHTDPTKFWEVVGGSGPRATPTFAAGRLYALGANGNLNCLDPATGAPIWNANIAEDAEAEIPMWGFSSSPLVVDDLVLVHAGGAEGAVLAYDAATGDLRWRAGEKGLSYASPHLAILDGVRQVLMVTGAGVFSLDPKTGAELWKHEWPTPGMARVVQPMILGDDSVLIGTGYGIGSRRLNVEASETGWNVGEQWTTKQLKPYYNDFVFHDGYIYGFDHNIFTCIDPETGKRKWKRGRYGFGQVLLVPDSDHLLIASEKGEIALLRANPQKHEELARFPVIDGKTWNHPVIAEGKLLVRNGEEAVCFSLPGSGTESTPSPVAADVQPASE